MHNATPTGSACGATSMPDAEKSNKWNPPTCAYRLQHLKASRHGAHAASVAGEVSKGGGMKLPGSRAMDAYLGTGEFAGEAAAPTGFVCDKDRPVRTATACSCTAPRHTPASHACPARRKVAARRCETVRACTTAAHAPARAPARRRLPAVHAKA